MIQHNKYTIVGLPSVSLLHSSSGEGGGRRATPIKRQLFTFLTEQIQKWKPDLIIVIERKGTAILRALKEWEESPLEWNWSQVISSDAIDQMPQGFFEGKRVLVFDDMMRTAVHMRRVLGQLSQRNVFEKCEVHLAIFAVHEECLPQIKFPGGAIGYDWFYRELLSEVYQSIHLRIVTMLQRAGSLMLDTEHVEVRIRLRNDFGRLFSALTRKAEALVFRSSDHRTNITVFYPDDQAHVLPLDLYPRGTSVSQIVKKCRVVDRGNDEYAIIPICFPSIPEHCTEWPISQVDTELVGDGITRSDIARFNAVGLLSALEVLRWVLKDLSVLTKSDYSISLPKSPLDRESKGGYHLQHLKVVFPTLDLVKLTERIASIDRQAAAEGSALRTIKFDDAQFPSVTNEELHRDAMRLLQIIRYELDERILEAELLATGGTPVEEVPGLTLGEILSIGDNFAWSRAKTSALCDILIDQAALSADISRVLDDSGKACIARTFAPAGEVVSEMVRRYTNQWGLPNGA